MELYRHRRKGKAYLLLHRAAHTETLVDYAVYRALYGDRLVWCRPLAMFVEGGRFMAIHVCDLTPEELRVLQEITT